MRFTPTSYNGLGMRLTKTDNSGGYAYLCDGVSPASPVLSDGQLSFTPGLSQTQGVGNGTYASHFYAEDALGNLRFMTDGSAQGFGDGWGWDGFGQLAAHAGSTAAPFGYGESSGYQTDSDTGLKLLGHRYYDSRTGRFISQDPAGDGDNWYAYCDNDPTDGADPDGLSMQMPPTGETMAHEAMMGFLGGLSFGGSGMGGAGSYTKTDYTYTSTRPVEQGTGIIGPWGPWELTGETSTTFDMGSSAMFAADPGRGGKQTRLRGLGDDPKVSSRDRGWIQQEKNAIKAGKRTRIRNPIGKVLAHRRGFEASKGYGYKYSDLQDSDLHDLQHKYEGYKSRPLRFLRNLIMGFGEDFGRSQLNGGAAADTALEQAAEE